MWGEESQILFCVILYLHIPVIYQRNGWHNGNRIIHFRKDASIKFVTCSVFETIKAIMAFVCFSGIPANQLAIEIA
jgi:hypothetical protein